MKKVSVFGRRSAIGASRDSRPGPSQRRQQAEGDEPAPDEAEAPPRRPGHGGGETAEAGQPDDQPDNGVGRTQIVPVDVAGHGVTPSAEDSAI